MYCPKCGNEIKDNVKFCGKCGTMVENKTYESTKAEKTQTEIKSKKGILGIVAVVCIAIIAAGIFLIKESELDSKNGEEIAAEEKKSRKWM